MQHNRLVFLAVFADVGNVKTLRQVHVYLNGAALPFAADGVFQDELQFGTVESAFAFVDLEFIAVRGQRVGQGVFAQIPDFVGADPVNAVRTGGKVDLDVFKTEVLVNVENQFQRGNALFFHLFRGAEDVGIVLGKFAYPHQPHQRTGGLVAVNLAEFGNAQRQVTVRFDALFVNQQAARAVHRFDAEPFFVFRLTGVVVGAVFVPVAGNFPQHAIHYPGGGNFDIAVVFLTVAHIFDQLAVNLVALVMPENRARCIFRFKVEKVHFASQFAVVAFFRLFQHGQIFLQVFFVCPGGGINALQHFAAGVAAPVGAGNFRQFKGVADLSGRRYVRSAAEVGEISLRVKRDNFVLRQVFDQFDLIVLAD